MVSDVALSFPGRDLKGGIKLAGNIVWAAQIRKVVKRSKVGSFFGIGGTTVEDITYFTDLGIQFARGRMRLKKLFLNGDLIFDMDALPENSTGVREQIEGGSGYFQAELPDPNIRKTDFQGRGIFTRLANTLLAELRGDMSMTFYEGNYLQPADPAIQADVTEAKTPAYRGRCLIVIQQLNLTKYNGLPTVLGIFENKDLVSLRDIAAHFCERVGIEPGDQDFEDLTSTRVRGLVVMNPQPPRQTLETAALPYNATFHESVDGQLVGGFLGQASSVTIPGEEWGFVAGEATAPEGDEAPKKLEFSLKDSTEAPRLVTVTAYSPDKNFAPLAQSAQLASSNGAGDDTVSLPMTLLPDEARQLAEKILYRAQAEREGAKVMLPWKYGYLNPTSVITVESEGRAHRLRIDSLSGALPGVQELATVEDVISAYRQTVSGAITDFESVVITSASVLAILIDTVALEDDTEPGFYAAIVARNGEFETAILYADFGNGYEPQATFGAGGIGGVLVDPVTVTNTTDFDDATIVTVDLYGTDTVLETKTDLEVLNGANAAIIGDGHVMQFANATQIDTEPNRWELSRLLFGRKGSDFDLSHAAGEKFVLLNEAVKFIPLALTQRNVSRNWKAVTDSQSLSGTGATALTWQARNLMPLSPVDVMGSRDGSNNLTIAWTRRTRIGGEMIDYTDAPLGEESERYAVDILDGVTVVRTIENTSQTASYSAADQTTDGLTPGDPVDLVVYQISARVGRGFGRKATV